MSNSPRSTLSCGATIGGTICGWTAPRAPGKAESDGFSGTSGKIDSPFCAALPRAIGREGCGNKGAAARAGWPSSPAIAHARNNAARRAARIFTRSWFNEPTALLSPQQETRIGLRTHAWEPPHSESLNKAR
jgi:hypothetical protein